MDWSYGEPTEMLNSKDEHGDKYIPKELVFQNLLMVLLAILSRCGQPVWLVTIDGHYADVGDSAALLSRPLNVPLLFTGYYHHAGDGTGIVRL